MCRTSVEPRPSTISSPVSAFQPLKTSAESTSAAESAMRSDEKSVAAGVRSRLGQRGVERRQAEEHGRTGMLDRVEDRSPASAGPAAAASPRPPRTGR